MTSDDFWVNPRSKKIMTSSGGQSQSRDTISYINMSFSVSQMSMSANVLRIFAKLPSDHEMDLSFFKVRIAHFKIQH